jgi:hypothetical protein
MQERIPDKPRAYNLHRQGTRTWGSRSFVLKECVYLSYFPDHKNDEVSFMPACHITGEMVPLGLNDKLELDTTLWRWRLRLRLWAKSWAGGLNERCRGKNYCCCSGLHLFLPQAVGM